MWLKFYFHDYFHWTLFKLGNATLMLDKSMQMCAFYIWIKDPPKDILPYVRKKSA